MLGRELMEVARCGLDGLPERQRTVVSLRDLLGMDSAEVCQLLGISVANQRVLLAPRTCRRPASTGRVSG